MASCFTLLLGLLLASASGTAPRPLPVATWGGKRVLVITAHPDDAEGFAGGLIRTLQLQGDIAVEYLIVTSGNAGGRCYNATAFYDCEKEEIAFTRRREAKAAAAFLGVSRVNRLGIGDGMSIAVHETRMRRAIAAYTRRFRPHIVFTHSPEPDFAAPPTCNGACAAPRNWDDLGYHPDHQHVGKIAFTALYGGGSAVDNDLVFEDLSSSAGAALEKWHVEQLYFFALTAKPMTHFLELNDNLLGAKVNSSSLHKSQYQGIPPWETFQFVAEQAGKVAGVPLAEGYQAWF
jgi:LmbE family N-acetylglucosaminyl deacetylase